MKSNFHWKKKLHAALIFYSCVIGFHTKRNPAFSPLSHSPLTVLNKGAPIMWLRAPESPDCLNPELLVLVFFCEYLLPRYCFAWEYFWEMYDRKYRNRKICNPAFCAKRQFYIFTSTAIWSTLFYPFISLHTYFSFNWVLFISSSITYILICKNVYQLSSIHHNWQ